MPAHNLSIQIQEVPRNKRRACPTLDKACIIAVRNEADVLTVMLPGVDEALLFRDFPDLLFGKGPQGKQRPSKLILGKRIKEVALVFRKVQGFFQQPASPYRIELHPGVMACSDRMQPSILRGVQEASEFQAAVAFKAGIRGPALLISADKGVYHVFPEIVLKGQHFKRNPQQRGDLAGVLNILLGAAGVRQEPHHRPLTEPSFLH